MSVDAFSIAWMFTGKAEGGWCNNPGDTGGETIFGISRVYHPSWPGWSIVDLAKGQPNFPATVNANPILHGLRQDFYKAEFWAPIQGDNLPLPLAVVVFDEAVNFNPVTATKRMQTILGVTPDGKIGVKTLAAANAMGFEAVIKFQTDRLFRYLADIAARPTDIKWQPVWFDRVIRLTVYAKEVATKYPQGAL